MMHLTAPDWEIRPVTEGEEAALLDVYRQCEDFLAICPCPPRASPEMIEGDLRLSREIGGTFCGIYLPGGPMIGVLDVVVGGYRGDPDVAFLELMMIAAPYRSAGRGAAVFHALEDDLRGRGVKILLSGVQLNNPGAIRFWQRMGFAITGEPIVLGGMPCYDLRKDLSE